MYCWSSIKGLFRDKNLTFQEVKILLVTVMISITMKDRKRINNLKKVLLNFLPEGLDKVHKMILMNFHPLAVVVKQ